MLADYPLARVASLRLPEAEVFNGADWRRPQCTPYGLAVARKADSSAAFSEETYRANFDRLRRALAQLLSRGYARVYTHNPWGEYGHEEHVQVYRAVKALQPALGFELWFDNYASNKSHELMLRHVGGFHSDYTTAPTDARLGEEAQAPVSAPRLLDVVRRLRLVHPRVPAARPRRRAGRFPTGGPLLPAQLPASRGAVGGRAAPALAADGRPVAALSPGNRHKRPGGEALMKVSVIMPCYNAAATIGAQLEALAVQSYPELGGSSLPTTARATNRA